MFSKISAVALGVTFLFLQSQDPVASDSDPSWSPDGTTILFYSDKSGRNQLYTMRADGSDWQPLLAGQREDSAGSWSHDGKRILFTSDAGHGVDIYTFDLRTKQEKQLTTNAPGLGVPFWSPDEKTIAFSIRRGERSDVYFMDADGLNQRKLFLADNVTRDRSARQAPLEQEGPQFTARGAFAAFVVTDLDASLRWYESSLDLRVIKRGVSPRVAAETVILGGHNVFVELIHYTDRGLAKREIDDRSPVAGPIKVGMIVGQKDFDSLTTYLEKRGASGGAFEDKEMGVRSSIFKDNDGNLIQFFTNNH
jgi:catechol 2,3-dioxygenase-like lactoylglutathione lyase family enzyme